MIREEIIDRALINFGKYVRDTRQKQGMSLQDLALKTGLSAAFIYRIEVGERRASLDTRLVILLCGFNWNKELVMNYLGRVVKNVKHSKWVAN
ncbi:helix-turn-helix transcriptional regulator [Caldifermentibacillus hisashii]|uniref:helix-turn-helix domain-containing protein n=1 Tax=Caldifermentibacillus hisashii TaxID=996558 RepID=UPI0034165EF1